MESKILLLDANVPLGLTDLNLPGRSSTAEPLRRLVRGGYRARCLAGQLREAYVVLTRSGNNGYAVSNALAVEAIRDLALAVPVLSESTTILSRWADVLEERAIIGLRAHDA